MTGALLFSRTSYDRCFGRWLASIYPCTVPLHSAILGLVGRSCLPWSLLPRRAALSLGRGRVSAPPSTRRSAHGSCSSLCRAPGRPRASVSLAAPVLGSTTPRCPWLGHSCLRSGGGPRVQPTPFDKLCAQPVTLFFPHYPRRLTPSTDAVAAARPSVDPPPCGPPGRGSSGRRAPHHRYPRRSCPPARSR